MSKQKKAYAGILAAASLWGCIGLFLRSLTALGLTSMQVVAVRLVVSAVVYAVYLLLTDRKAMKIRLCDSWYFIGTGILSLVFFNWCYFSAISKSTIAIAAVLLYTAPAFVMLMSAVIFKEKLTKRKLSALALTFLGCVLVTGVLGAGGGISLAALLLGLGSGLGYALYSIFAKLAMKRYCPATVTVYTFIFGALGALPLSLIDASAASFLGGRVLLVGVGVGVICSVLPYILYTKGLRTVEPGQAAILATIEPVVAAVMSVALFSEEITLMKVSGMLLVISAITILNAKIGRKRSQACAVEIEETE